MLAYHLRSPLLRWLPSVDRQLIVPIHSVMQGSILPLHNLCYIPSNLYLRGFFWIVSS